MTYTYTPHGVCSRKIVIDIDENTDTINSVSFTGGATVIFKAFPLLLKAKSLKKLLMH